MDLDKARNILTRVCDDWSAAKELRDAITATQNLESQIVTLRQHEQAARAAYEQAVDARRSEEARHNAWMAKLIDEEHIAQAVSAEQVESARAAAQEAEEEAAHRIRSAQQKVTDAEAASAATIAALKAELESITAEVEAAHAARKELAARLGG